MSRTQHRSTGGRARRWMIAILLILLVGLAVALAIYRSDMRLPSEAELAPYEARMSDPAFIQHGEYLARAGDCIACHIKDESLPYAGGTVFKTPFGTIYSPNITPDPKTGIGNWSNAEFVRAMHQGVRADGSYLYPAFPYTSYTKLSLEDVLAIRAYLATLEPIEYQPPENELTFPFNIRLLLLGWQTLFLDEERYEPNPQKSAEWNRGFFLVEALGHCGDCHTPRNIFQGLTNKKFAGTEVEGWYAYNITPDPMVGIGRWSDEELLRYLETGIAPGKATASGPMAKVVEHSTRFLTPEDQQAMVTYLRSVEPISAPVERPRGQWGEPAQDVVALRGKQLTGDVTGDRLYLANCASCHGWTGAGVGGNVVGSYPRLFDNADVGSQRTQNLLRIILHGIARETDDGKIFMPGFAGVLSEQEIVDLSNYVIRQFGNPEVAPVTVADVRKLQDKSH